MFPLAPWTPRPYDGSVTRIPTSREYRPDTTGLTDARIVELLLERLAPWRGRSPVLPARVRAAALALMGELAGSPTPPPTTRDAAP